MANEGKGSQGKNTLTQDEIDAELFGGGSKKESSAAERKSAPSAHEEGISKRNPFDLRAQKYYSQEYRALQAEVEGGSGRFIRSLQKGAYDLLRHTPAVRLSRMSAEDAGVRLMNYRDYINSNLPTPSRLYAVHLISGGNFLLVFDMSLASSIVDQYFGGSGLSRSAEMRFTENEQRAIVELVCCIRDSLLDVWSPARHAGGVVLGDKHAEASSEPEDQISSDSNPTPAFLNQVANDTDIVVVSSFDVEFELENEINGGKMQVVLPIHTLKALNKMGEKAGASGRSEEEDWHALLKREFLDLCVEVRAELGSGTVTLGDLMERKPGTLWPIRIPEEVAAMVSGVPLFTGKLGVHQGNRAIQVTSLHAGGRLLQQAVKMSAPSEPGAHEHAE